MICVRARKNFIDLVSNNSYVLRKIHVSFSTTREKKSLNTNTPYDLLLHKHNFSSETVFHIASVLPLLKNPQKCVSILSFLRDIGFSNSQLEKVVKDRPRFLSSSLEKSVKPKINIFKNLGYSANELAEFISNDPWILYPSISAINFSLTVLKGIVGSNAEVAKLLKTTGWFLRNDLRKNLVPNVELLRSCGIPLEQIIKHMYQFPRYLLNVPEVMKKGIIKADEMGVPRGCKNYIHAVRIASSLSDETWETKLKAFRDFGFSEDDIVKAYRQAPPVFGISVKKMMQIKETVLSNGMYDVSCIANNPTFLCRSVENLYKPRLQVLEVLKRKKLIENWPPFTTTFHMANSKFIEKFVRPYLDELGDVDMAKNVVSGKENVNPVSST